MYESTTESCLISSKENGYSVFFSPKDLFPSFASFAFHFQTVKVVFKSISCCPLSIPHAENRLSYLLVSYKKCIPALFIFYLSLYVYCIISISNYLIILIILIRIILVINYF